VVGLGVRGSGFGGWGREAEVLDPETSRKSRSARSVATLIHRCDRPVAYPPTRVDDPGNRLGAAQRPFPNSRRAIRAVAAPGTGRRDVLRPQVDG
jgi:hypothetical protein